MEIAGRKIGQEPFFVAEIGSNHDGKLERAKRLINLAAEAGANAAKFQHFRPETLLSKRDGDPDAWTMLERLAVPPEWTPKLAECCHQAGLAFISTPFDLERANELEPYVDAWKIASGDLTYLDLIHHVATKQGPVLVATGASTLLEVNAAVRAFVYGGKDPKDLVVMQCNANYSGDWRNLPHANVRVIQRFTVPVKKGLSDHTAGHRVVCAAVALGACVIEKHFTDDRMRPGPDHHFAMTPVGWREMVKAAYETWVCLGDGKKKVETNEDPVLLRRALRWAQDLPKGSKVMSTHVTSLRPRPEGSLERYRLGEVIGRRLGSNVKAETLVRLEDLA